MCVCGLKNIISWDCDLIDLKIKKEWVVETYWYYCVLYPFSLKGIVQKDQLVRVSPMTVEHWLSTERDGFCNQGLSIIHEARLRYFFNFPFLSKYCLFDNMHRVGFSVLMDGV